jgi:thymidine kinase
MLLSPSSDQYLGFGSILNLLPLAESVTKLNAVCQHCNRDAPFTKRLGKETAIEVIGGSERYAFDLQLNLVDLIC